jgi:hypothetical protein
MRISQDVLANHALLPGEFCREGAESAIFLAHCRIAETRPAGFHAARTPPNKRFETGSGYAEVVPGEASA